MARLTANRSTITPSRNRKCPALRRCRLFLGTVRDLTGEFVTVALDHEAYGPMAEKKLAEIETEVRRRWPVGNVAMIHRLGRLAVGDVSVAVAVSCPHRGEAFEACRFAIESLKELVPIWKKENAPDGTGEWVHQSARACVSDRRNLRE